MIAEFAFMMCRIMKCQSIHLASNQSSIILHVAEASQRAGRVPLTTSKVLPPESTKRKKVFFRLVLSSLIRTFDYVESTSARKHKTKKGVLSFGAFLAYSYLCRRKDDCDAFVRQAAHLNRQKLHP